MEKAARDTRLGALALERGLISRAELDALIDRSRGERAPPRRVLLGELLVKERYLGATLLSELLHEQRQRQRGATDAKAPAPPPDAPATLDACLAALEARSARALVLVAGRRPALRTLEGLEPLPHAPITKEQLDAMGLERGPFTRGGQRFRATLGDSLQGRSVVVKPVGLDARSRTLRLPGALAALADERRGLILIAGARAGVIADVLARLVAQIGDTSRRHVIVVEKDPLYEQAPARGLVAERAVGAHTPSFSTALRAALREDPDVVAIGEMHDGEAIATALLAAETGHLVLAGVHAADAPQAIRRVLASQSASRRALARTTLANTLRALAVVEVARGKSGWHVIADVLPGTAAMAALIREDRLHHIESSMRTQPGAVTRDERLSELAATGEVPRVAALERASDPEAIDRTRRSTKS